MQGKKDEKNQKALRAMIASDPANKVCFNCTAKGPLYVVMDFQIFICSSCAAHHRSFQHKVKGISMSSFTDEDMAEIKVSKITHAAGSSFCRACFERTSSFLARWKLRCGACMEGQPPGDPEARLQPGACGCRSLPSSPCVALIF